MKLKVLTCLGIGACLSLAVNAQTPEEEVKGKAILQTFANFHTGFGTENDDRGFELDRTYVGYEYKLPHGLSMKGVMDIGAKTDGYDRVAYIKNAQVTWKRGKWVLNGGLISTTQFNMIEKFWGYRYLYKSFQDEYKFGSSADLGISAAFAPAEWVTIDGIIVNGEGYKKVQVKDGLLYGIGATFTPLERLVVRAYFSVNEQVDADENEKNLSVFVGYKGLKCSLGAEYNLMKSDDGVEDQDRSGFSIYGTFTATERLNIFARYDNISSEDDWKISDDESLVLVGTQFKVGKYVKLAPNFRLYIPKEDDVDNKPYLYISCYFGL